MHKKDPEGMARKVVEACADCDICRYLMEDTSCLLFPELYRLYDTERETGEEISPAELRNLVDLCNFCGLCPCPNIHTDIMKAKSAFVSRDGLKPAIRLLENVERMAKLCGATPRLTNLLFETGFTGEFLKKLAGIHPERKLPSIPKGSFPQWAGRRALTTRRNDRKRKVAYFAGCTGQYLFPDVPGAAVEVLERNGVAVTYPEQKCCGMPSLLEGDEKLTFEFAAFNLDRLSEAVEEGCDIVCSCPTCGYMLKHVLRYGAFCSGESHGTVGPCKDASNREGPTSESGREQTSLLSKSLLTCHHRDEGYFAPLDAGKRIKVADHTYDLGEYLRNLHRSGEFNTNLGPLPAPMAYYPPCHLREQKVGEPFVELLSLVPEISLEKIQGAFYCCGMGGIMGFKRDFHNASIEMGSRLMERIKAIRPERLVSDCLSCRLQFNHLLPYQVLHPVEVLSESYGVYGA